MKVSPGATQARGRADQNGSARVGAYARMLCRWLDDEVLMEVISPTAAWLYCVLTMTSARAESDGWLSRRQAQRAVSTEDGSDLEEFSRTVCFSPSRPMRSMSLPATCSPATQASSVSLTGSRPSARSRRNDRRSTERAERAPRANVTT